MVLQRRSRNEEHTFHSGTPRASWPPPSSSSGDVVPKEFPSLVVDGRRGLCFLRVVRLLLAFRTEKCCKGRAKSRREIAHRTDGRRGRTIISRPSERELNPLQIVGEEQKSTGVAVARSPGLQRFMLNFDIRQLAESRRVTKVFRKGGGGGVFSCFQSKHLTDSTFKLQFRWEKNGRGRGLSDSFPFS